MARLIDADALKEFIDDCGICAICPQKAPRCSYDCDFPDFVTEKWNVAIDAQPTIDAVSVVRCKDCKHWWTSGCIDMFGQCELSGYVKNQSDFCSKGEYEETDHE